MAVTEANDHIGLAGTMNINRRSCGKILKLFLRRGEKNIWGSTIGRNASENKHVLQLLFVETCLLVQYLKNLFLKIYGNFFLKIIKFFFKIGFEFDG